MSPKLAELIEKLREILQIDKPELDFGIYRVIRARAAQINRFLDESLPQKVRTVLAENAAAEKSAIETEIAAAEQAARDVGIDVDAAPKVLELRSRLAGLDSALADSESIVYAHLLAFFSRYYDAGDFISKRRYKGDVYAVPYAGEEVKLHWANADQYYTKTGENFTDYSFRLSDGARVNFKLVSAAVAKDNVKDADAVRCFTLWESEEAAAAAAEETEADDAESGDDVPASALPDKILEEKNGELFIYFQYKKFPKGTKQKELAKDAREKIAAELTRADLLTKFPLLAPAPTENDRERTVLDRELTRYVAKNTSDYFIHKDLKGFLTRELDFYVKNEMMQLDDIQNAATFRQIEGGLRRIQAVRAVALELIDFMAQLEEFQKSLWLKKKFVVQCDYCLTLDRVPAEMLDEVLANAAQKAEWEKLGFPPLPEAVPAGELPLAERKLDSRMIDTKFFPPSFKEKLLASIDDIDEQCDGVLVRSENFQALNLLRERYRGQISGIHIDPPYNTDTSGFLYKNSYQHSSWMSMMHDRIAVSLNMLSPHATVMCHIDENEYERLKLIFDELSLNDAGTLVWDKRNPMTGGGGVAKQHEYIVCRTNYEDAVRVKNENVKSILETAKRLIAQNGGIVDSGVRKKYSEWIRKNENLSGGEKAYSMLDDLGSVYSSVSLRAPEPRSNPKFHIPLIHPITQKACPVPPNGFSRTPETLQGMIQRGEIIFGVDETTQPRQKRILTVDEKKQINSVISDAKKGKSDLEAMQLDFPYCHSVRFYEKLVSSMDDSSVLDYFAGSGTTGHAVINLNREDGGKRKYILVEMGEHFETVLKPRIEKVVYSPNWKNGKPQDSDQGVSHCFKYMTLESYEDALTNLELADAGGSVPAGLFDQYLLRYMLRTEARASRLSTEDFRKPFDFTLNVAADASGATEPRKVDLVETFNWLLGLRVRSLVSRREKGYVRVEGELPDGRRALILWRDCEKIDDAALAGTLERLSINLRSDADFDVFYVNGDHALPNVSVTDGDDASARKKVLQIEDEFLRRMFEEDV